MNKRLARGDRGINPLDDGCRAHDIIYDKFKSGRERTEADVALGKLAWDRAKSSDASMSERLASLGVAAAMKGKTALAKIGSGIRTKKSKKKKTDVGGKKKATNKKRRRRMWRRRKRIRRK